MLDEKRVWDFGLWRGRSDARGRGLVWIRFDDSTYLVPLDYSLCRRVEPEGDHVNHEVTLHACQEQWPGFCCGERALECGLKMHNGDALGSYAALSLV